MNAPIPGILLVLDGWGHAEPSDANALTAAATPYLDRLRAECPAVLAEASGTAVGLLPGTVGNSEIGHMVIGAGRPLPYDSVLVQEQIDSGQLRGNPQLVEVCARLAETGNALHLIGLCSDGMIHANVHHLQELLRAAAELEVPDVFIHAITDGRDVSDNTGAAYLGLVEKYATEAGTGRIASVVGRGYAMDKSGNLQLTEQAADAVTVGRGEAVSEPQDALELTTRGDEWVPACVITSDEGLPAGPVRDGDAVLFTNFRSDRIQQLADLLHSRLASREVTLLSLAQYDTRAAIPALVPRGDAGDGLAVQLAAHGIRSVRIAEAEKFEHVTYYLNGRDAAVQPTEEHVKVTGGEPPDYQARPQMNLAKVTEVVCQAAARSDVPLVIANLANIDVVGHTGHFDATRQAAEHTDRAVEEICDAARATGRWVLLVGDHGNAEKMRITSDGQTRPYGGHTTNPVPAVLVAAEHQNVDLPTGTATLADIAPSVLSLLALPPTKVMTGRPLW
ncbi:2,3-bisphosphoglycerate-independent phosphoglycerate mutase [Streptomyces sp. NPDC001910]|uniref:2,3-bisphosphoglycerate-independent phosphoglycerate mutase n=1 Tax=Streptomyces sp. NPDC001910 TaxID=3154403 RepID=UPI00332191FE